MKEILLFLENNIHMDDNNSINKSIDDIIDYFNCLDENYDFEFLMGILKKSNRLNELIRYISNMNTTKENKERLIDELAANKQ